MMEKVGFHWSPKMQKIAEEKLFNKIQISSLTTDEKVMNGIWGFHFMRSIYKIFR